MLGSLLKLCKSVANTALFFAKAARNSVEGDKFLFGSGC